ncbi:OLC1v1030305C1 [Oldenlandia corymbosa var. corymbosa]|uniref:OLC1v1030305C1 n=1 Tax=Oldenlandia corymbosa var. corymbosa TaxID=529605 RepID=A0AAV1CHQ3_OLDCO|nr:OLC1v1030305C1 [Oldenlandia corymbosa var. corymbosa]
MGKDICDWEIFVSNCSGYPMVTTFVPRHKCKFRHKNKSVTYGLAGHNQRKCPFIDPIEGVVDLGSNEDDLSDVVQLNVKTVAPENSKSIMMPLLPVSVL